MISVRTPFRLPIGGGGTDLPSYYSKHEGLLLTATINKYMIININISALVNKIRVAYSETENVDIENIEEIRHDIVRETLKYLNYRSRIDITSMADLPAGTGMGSSSSFTVGLLHALMILQGKNFSKKELADLACKIEINKCHKPIGKQDQYASAFGGINLLCIDKKGKVNVSKVNLEPEIIHELEYRLLLFYTGIRRDANKILAEQSRKASEDSLDTATSMHMIKDIGKNIHKALINGDIDLFGNLLNEHWNIKRRISNKMTNQQINKWYRLAQMNGALGGKIMGAGGGGVFLFCVKTGERKKLRQVMEKERLRFLDFRFDWEGSKLLVNF